MRSAPTADAARNVRHEPATPWHEIVAKAQIESEIIVFDAAKNRFRHGTDIKLIVTAEPRVAIYNSPSNPSCEKFSSDFVAGGRVDRTKKICRLNGKLKARRIKVAAPGFDLRFSSAAEKIKAIAEKQQDSRCAGVFHSRATIGTLNWIAIAQAPSCPYRVKSVRSGASALVHSRRPSIASFAECKAWRGKRSFS